MNKVLLDTDILSYFFKGNRNVISNVESYLNSFDTLNISIITYYEIAGGLLAKNAITQIKVFNNFVLDNTIVELNESSAKVSAELYAKLRNNGNIVDDIDLLIAGIAMSNDMTLVTNNEKHFSRIEGLKIENWTKRKRSDFGKKT